MGKFITVLMCLLAPSLAFALPVPHKTVRHVLDTSATAGPQVQLGTQLVRNKIHVMRAVYDYSILGGSSAAAISLHDSDGKAAILPSGAIIKRTMIDVITAPRTNRTTGDFTGGTIGLSAQTSGDLKATNTATTALASGLVEGIPVGTAATSIKLTAARTIQATIGVAALTAGKFNVIIEYYLTD